jgi:hypothetical protein
VEQNFRDYLMIHIADAPKVTTAFIRSDAPLGGLGEPCVPPWPRRSPIRSTPPPAFGFASFRSRRRR